MKKVRFEKVYDEYVAAIDQLLHRHMHNEDEYYLAG